MEANQEKRDKYQEIIKDICHESLVYLDEGGIELTILQRQRMGKKGEKLVAKKSGKKFCYNRTNIIAGLVNDKLIAPMVFNGTYWAMSYLKMENSLHHSRNFAITG